jgi:hypothetical protein
MERGKVRCEESEKKAGGGQVMAHREVVVRTTLTLLRTAALLR